MRHYRHTIPPQACVETSNNHTQLTDIIIFKNKQNLSARFLIVNLSEQACFPANLRTTGAWRYIREKFPETLYCGTWPLIRGGPMQHIHSKSNVLVVDEEESVRFILEQYLNRSGYRVQASGYCRPCTPHDPPRSFRSGPCRIKGSRKQVAVNRIHDALHGQQGQYHRKIPQMYPVSG